MSSSSFAPLVFTGVSQYSSDFQTIISRAVSIASLPVKQLQNRQSDILAEKMAASGLSAAVAALSESVTALGKLGGNKALSATSMNTGVVNAAVTGNTQPGSYTISNVSSVATSASEVSLQGYAAGDAPSAAGLYTLSAGGKTYSIDLSAGNNNLTGLRDAINALPAGLSATVFTAPTGSYLSVSSLNTGLNPISLAAYPPTGSAVTGPVSIAAGVNDQLTVATDSGTDQVTLSSASTTLADVVNDFNSQATHSVASIMTDASGDHLVIQSLTAGAGAAATVSGTAVSAGGDALGLGGAALLTSNNPGSNTQFDFDGIPVTLAGTSDSNLVSGVTFTFSGTTTGSVGVTLSSDRSQLASALQNLVSNYNTVANQVNAQMGSNAGPLSGNSIVRDIRGAMLALTTYQSGSGQVQSLSALGIQMDSTGQMSFNPDTLNALSGSQISDAFSFLGTATTGLGAVANKFTAISDPITGEIQAQLKSWDQANSRLSNQIGALTNRISDMQAALSAKLQAADSLIASLTSQQTLLTSSIQSLNYTSFGKAPGSN
jgi:flagellar hook-associated protein 2